jgi:hypothetical protein
MFSVEGRIGSAWCRAMVLDLNISRTCHLTEQGIERRQIEHLAQQLGTRGLDLGDQQEYELIFEGGVRCFFVHMFPFPEAKFGF